MQGKNKQLSCGQSLGRCWHIFRDMLTCQESSGLQTTRRVYAGLGKQPLLFPSATPQIRFYPFQLWAVIRAALAGCSQVWQQQRRGARLTHACGFKKHKLQVTEELRQVMSDRKPIQVILGIPAYTSDARISLLSYNLASVTHNLQFPPQMKLQQAGALQRKVELALFEGPKYV